MVWWCGVACLLVAGCANQIQNKEAVRQAIADHLAKNSGLNMDAVDMEIRSVSFQKDRASAAVMFRPKGSSSGDGMQMSYELERQGSRWVVKGRSESRGSAHGAVVPGAAMPPNHPPVAPGAEPRPNP